MLKQFCVYDVLHICVGEKLCSFIFPVKLTLLWSMLVLRNFNKHIALRTGLMGNFYAVLLQIHPDVCLPKIVEIECDFTMLFRK